MDLSLKYWRFNAEIHGFHNIQSEIWPKYWRNLKDLRGFQDDNIAEYYDKI